MESAEGAPKFRQFSKEEIASLVEKFASIRKKFSLHDGGVDVKIGDQVFCVGSSTEENSTISVLQLYVSLALSEGVEGADAIAGDKYNLDATKLVEGQALKDLKILDLGCGGRPFFSVVARKMGATVYTADILDYDSMIEQYRLDEELSKEDLEELRKYHIVVDLDDSKVLEEINDKSGNGFNLVTESHLENGAIRDGKNYGSYRGKDISKGVISSGGVYYNANSFDELIHASDL